jgi:hypothetical protein
LIAKEQLKWNDFCIQLFWDTLQAAVRSRKEDAGVDWASEYDLIEIEFISIFLILHVQDSNLRPQSPTTSQFESVWPHDRIEMEGLAVDGPRSPVKLTSPPSPRKAFNFPIGSTSSPKQV